MRADLHIHTTRSKDGRTPPAEAVRFARKAGLGCVAFTDHNDIGAVADAGANLGIIVIGGVEVSTDDGHIILLGVSRNFEKGATALETCESAMKEGAVVIVPHPYRLVTGVGERLARSLPADAIEGINGRSLAMDNERSKKIAKTRNKPMVGGSDAHLPEEIGNAFTLIPDECASAEDVLEAIRKGRTSCGGKSAMLGPSVRRAFQNTGRYLRRGFRQV